MSNAPGPTLANRRAVAEERISAAVLARANKVDLSDLRLGQVPSAIGGMRNLRSLILRGNDLESIPQWLLNLDSLTTLDLGDNKLSEMPDWIGQMANLTSITLCNNQLRQVPPPLRRLYNLHSIDIGENKIHELPFWMEDLNLLRSINISYTDLTELPSWLSGLTNLQELDISGIQFAFLSRDLLDIDSLISLRANGTNHELIWTWASKLSKLKELALAGSNLYSLPQWMEDLKHLTHLQVDHCKLGALPYWLRELTALDSLSIGFNPMSLPTWVGDFFELKELDISGLKLNSVPDWLCNFKKLSLLSLSTNGLRDLPHRISELAELKGVDISYNALAELPESFRELPRLQYLNAKNNNLTAIPSWIFLSATLRELDVRNNRVSEIPQELQSSTLSWLRVRGNERLPADKLLLERTDDPDTLITALFSEFKVPLNEVRIVIVGEGEAGKTTIKNQLLRSSPGEPQQTVNIEIEQWAVDLADRTVLARVWDFGGQRVYQATHQFFFSDRCVYLLVWSTRQNNADVVLEKWLKTIRTYGHSDPIIVIKNRHDSDADIRMNSLRETYGPNLHFVDVNGRSGEGIESLCLTIKDIIGNMPEIRSVLPSKWVALKAKVSAAASSRAYLWEHDYLKLCAGLIDSDDARQSMLSTLDSLGIALKYRSRRGLLILDSNWIVHRVYRLLSSPADLHKNGVMSITAAAELLTDLRCTGEDIDFIFGFMQSANLCVRVPSEADESYLIPDLSIAELPSVPDWSETTNIIFRYDQVLEGLMARLIVDQFPLIESGQHWRTGFVAKYRGRLTRFELFESLNELHVVVEYRDMNSRLALNAAVAMVEKLNKSMPYSNVACEILVPCKSDSRVRVKLKSLLAAEERGLPAIPEGDTWIDVSDHLGGVRVVARQNLQTVVHNYGTLTIDQRQILIPRLDWLIEELTKADGGVPAPETRALGAVLTSSDVNVEASLEAVANVSSKGPDYVHIFEKFIEEGAKELGKSVGSLVVESAGDAVAKYGPSIVTIWHFIEAYLRSR